MTGQTNPRDAPACIALAQRQIGNASGWTPEQWQAQLEDDGMVRAVDGVQTMFYRPYKTALTYLLRPQITNRTEGDVSEAYSVSLIQNLAEQLRDADTEWVAAKIPPESASTDTWDSSITWGSW